MPVARGPQINARSAVVVGLTGVVIALLLGGFVIWLASQSSDVEIFGSRDFNAGDIGAISREIDDRGPILYSDVGSRRERDIILQHLGDDEEEGWLAFAARRPEDPRDCFFTWDPEAGDFFLTSDTDTVCDDVRVDAMGTGLVAYTVEIRDGDIRVLLNEATDTDTENDTDEDTDTDEEETG